MSPVRIVGGGLLGVAAAFEAHRLGCRDIELHERFELLGGAALPRLRDGVELRDRQLLFGPRGDPLRALLEWQGLAFEDVEDACGAVSPGLLGERLHLPGLAGPALTCRAPTLNAPAGDTLAARLRAYPTEIEHALARYCNWRLGAWLDRVHESAAAALDIARVRPLATDLSAHPAPEPVDPLWDIYYARPDQTAPTAALPREGLTGFFHACHRRLRLMGVRVFENSFVSPRQLAAAYEPGEVVVWAADPTPLFDAMGLPRPAPSSRTFASYQFSARWSGPTPFQVRNFTADGAVFSAFIYRSRGETVLAAECVGEVCDHDLRRELRSLLAGFGGDLILGEALGVSLQPRWDCLSLQTVRGLADLRGALDRRFGPAFVPGAWEAVSPAAAFVDLRAGLAQGLAHADLRVAA